MILRSGLTSVSHFCSQTSTLWRPNGHFFMGTHRSLQCVSEWGGQDPQPDTLDTALRDLACRVVLAPRHLGAEQHVRYRDAVSKGPAQLDGALGPLPWAKGEKRPLNLAVLSPVLSFSSITIAGSPLA